VTLKKKNTSD